MKNYSDYIYGAAQARAPMPTAYDVLHRDPRDLGSAMATGLLPTIALQRLCHVEMRGVIDTWLHAHYGTKLQRAPRSTLYGVDLQGHGVLRTAGGSLLVDSVMVSCQGWNEGALTPAAASSALVKARAAGCDGAVLLLVNQNSLSFALWEVEVPVVGYMDRLFSAFRARAEVLEAAYGGERSASVPGVANYPIIATRQAADESRIAVIVKEMSVKESAKRLGGVISPSEISITKCDRRIAYGLKKTPRVDQFALDLYRVFAYGTAIHNLVQRLLLESLSDLVDEIRISNPDLRIAGSGDVADLADAVLLEIKSMSTHQHKKLRSPKPDHQVQATIYAKAGTRTFKVVIYIYIDKELYTLKELPTQADANIWHRTTTRARGILTALKEHTLPPQIDEPGECGQCPFGHACKPEIYAKNLPESRALQASRARRSGAP
jgi:hypothetical protein